MNNSPEELSRILRSVENIPGNERDEVFAEASFRIGVHPSTPVHEALQHLRNALRIDGTNPRYAYHLSRLYFNHGDLENAKQYIRMAVTLCPTSHRIWAHISILQRELNSLFQGNTDYETDALKERSAKIIQSVKDGKDSFDSELIDFMPPQSRALLEEKARQKGTRVVQEKPASSDPKPLRVAGRALDPGKCRWTGVHDLEIESLLEGSPSVRSRDEILPRLEQFAKLAVQRIHGVSSFVVLAIEWLIAGYPVATIRRLQQVLTAQNQKAMDLLNQICDLYESKEDELPQRIATAVETRKIPIFLAAIIHKRRILWRPLEFRQLEEYRSAKEFISYWNDRNSEEEPFKMQLISHFDNLERAVKALHPSPSPPIPDALPRSETIAIDAPTAVNILSDLENAAKTLQDLYNNAFLFLREKLEPAVNNIADSNDCSLCTANHQSLIEILKQFGSVADKGIERLDHLTAQVTNMDHSAFEEGFALRMENCRKSFNKLKMTGNFMRQLQKLDKLIKASAEKFEAVKISPAEELQNLNAAILGVLTGEGADPVPSSISEHPAKEGEPPFESGSGGGSGNTTRPRTLDGLKEAVRDLETAIDQYFEKSYATFAPYSEKILLSTPFQSLRFFVLSKNAEALFRLGFRDRARRIWNRILKEDRLNIVALKNIAVCDFYNPDLARSTASWRAYGEMLYFYDIVGGDPALHASERTNFHSQFASAYAPSFLETKLDKEWKNRIDISAILSFFNNPSRIRAYVDHKLLEFLNRKLDFISPSLLLGVRKSEKEEVQTHALESMIRFSENTCRLLPQRVAQPFANLAVSHLKKAFDRRKTTEGLALQPDAVYSAERDKQVRWVSDVCWLLFRFHLILTQFDEVPQNIASVDFLEQLDRLRSIPIDLSPEFVESAAASLPFENVETMQKQLSKLNEIIIFHLLQFIFAESSDPDLQNRQYRRLVDEWVHRPVLEPFLDWINDPHQFYPPELKRALETNSPSAEAFDQLIKLRARFPEITGPAFYLVSWLSKQNKVEEALSVVKEAEEKGFSEKAREDLRNIRHQLELKVLAEKGEYKQAIEVLKKVMLAHPGEVEYLNHFASMYAQWVESNGHEDLSAQIHKDFEWWFTSAGTIEESVRNEAVRLRRQLVVKAAIAPIGPLGDDSKWAAVYNAVSRVLELDNGNLEAVYLQMISSFRIGCVRIKTDPREARDHLLKSADLANRVMNEADDSKRREEAKHVLDQVETIRDKLQQM